MRHYLILIIALFYIKTSFGQENKYNLNFEQSLSQDSSRWHKKNDDTKIQLDSVVKREGSFSLNIKPIRNVQGMYGVVDEINSTFKGDSIHFRGYLKAKGVRSAYFYLIVGTEHDQFAFDLSRTISGNTDWEEFEINLPYTSEATKVTVACNIEGTGEVWIDDLKLSIDGENLNSLKPISEVAIANSGFVIQNLSEEKKERLVLIGQLWGFLKYYHPAVSSGKFDWDKKLFEVLDLINEENFETELEKWVVSLGNFKPSKCETDLAEIKQKPNFSWFQNGLISPVLQEKLEKIEKAARPKASYYVQLSKDIHSPLFQNEKRHSSIDYNDDGMKLLALFRYWNYIQYFYPYKYLISENWDDVLEQFIGKMVETKNETEYTLALAELVSKTDDTHHQLLQNAALESYLGKKRIPASAVFIENFLVVSNSRNNKLKAGDIIEEIDNVPIKELREKYYAISGASNESTINRELAKKILRTSKDTVLLAIHRGKKLIKFEVPTVNFYEYISDNSAPAINEISQTVGYLNTSKLTLKDYDSIFRNWKNKKAIIFDLRTYPRENLARILPYLSEEPTIFFRSTSGSVNHPGIFTFDDPVVFDTKDGYKYNGKIIILVNSDSQSKAEFSAMALRTASNSLVIGSQTAGTDGDIVDIVLPGNVRTIMTGNGIYNADKTETQQVGILPDIKVSPRIQDFKNHTDRVLEVAIKEAQK